MNRTISAVLAGFCLSLVHTPVVAGPTADVLGKCMADNTSPKDRATMIRWIFGLMSYNPALADIVTLSSDQRNVINANFQTLFERLLTVDCKNEAVSAFKAEGVDALGESFSTFGEAAGSGIVADPAVSKQFEAWGSKMMTDKIIEVMKEAGISPWTGAPKSK